jgi:hypothetical protein
MVGAFELFKASAGLDVSDGVDGFGINTRHGPGGPSMTPRTFQTRQRDHDEAHAGKAEGA